MTARRKLSEDEDLLTLGEKENGNQSIQTPVATFDSTFGHLEGQDVIATAPQAAGQRVRLASSLVYVAQYLSS